MDQFHSQNHPSIEAWVNKKKKLTMIILSQKLNFTAYVFPTPQIQEKNIILTILLLVNCYQLNN